ncbi:hypothetical protein K458DRAFT_285089 [Lentithecium fluviatile CBS 122367]|uniref:Uncharacterized protein n=1 Tax=Lentithecium fluviatile CBS 122367 TaxID=1168545 RepID=A0A6G1JNR2_9PLEO|nr:hypothetical protein K458DRAFT_285089 [Lentithecium fluviatile CBS 122367]
MDFFSCIRPPTLSPLFLLPVELRLSIYEFVFSSAPPEPEQWPLPKSSASLEPLLTCRDIYREAKLIAFACTIHNLNWTRPSNCLRRLRTLEPAHHNHIRHIALTTTASGLFEKLLPLRQHFDHTHAPYLTLESLTIVLDVPDTSRELERERRLQEQNMVFASIWYFKNVNRVVLMNIMHREGLRDHPGMHGHWTCINEEKSLQAAVMDMDTSLIDSIRWRFELTSFYDYAWKPWLA